MQNRVNVPQNYLSTNTGNKAKVDSVASAGQQVTPTHLNGFSKNLFSFISLLSDFQIFSCSTLLQFVRVSILSLYTSLHFKEGSLQIILDPSLLYLRLFQKPCEFKFISLGQSYQSKVCRTKTKLNKDSLTQISQGGGITHTLHLFFCCFKGVYISMVCYFYILRQPWV